MQRTALVSKHVFEPGARPRFARRFDPVSETDSGWCFLSGHPAEDADDFGDIPANFHRNTLAELVALFPELVSFIGAPVGLTFEWSDDDAAYHLAHTA